MKIEELRKKIIQDNINIKVIRVIVDEKIILANATGCYSDHNNIWHIYSVSDRNHFRIVESGDEEVIIQHFYEMIKSMNETYKEYGDVWS